jgi:hypothetical protein
MEYVDYYAELGIPRDAPQDEIGPAFKKLARKYHPDVNKEPGAEDRFKRIVEAHEVLKDPESRKKYDRFGSAWNRVGNAPEADDPLGRARGQRGPRVRADEAGARGFSEIFEAMFGRGAPRGGFGGVPGGAAESMAEAGCDLSGHESQPLTENLVRQADLIWTMTAAHRAAILAQFPEAGGRVGMLSPDRRDVLDPVGGNLETYRKCARQIHGHLAERMDTLGIVRRIV